MDVVVDKKVIAFDEGAFVTYKSPFADQPIKGVVVSHTSRHLDERQSRMIAPIFDAARIEMMGETVVREIPGTAHFICPGLTHTAHLDDSALVAIDTDGLGKSALRTLRNDLGAVLATAPEVDGLVGAYVHSQRTSWGQSENGAQKHMTSLAISNPDKQGWFLGVRAAPGRAKYTRMICYSFETVGYTLYCGKILALNVRDIEETPLPPAREQTLAAVYDKVCLSFNRLAYEGCRPR